MKFIKFDLVGQRQTAEKYDSEVEYQKIENKIEKLYGKPIFCPFVPIFRNMQKGN